MIRIGFDDDTSTFEDTLQETKDSPEGQRQREAKISLDDVYVSEARLEDIKRQYSMGVVVNNYGDDYHISEEQRQKNNQYYEVYKPLKRAKRKYRKIDEWIKVMRQYMAAIKVIAENNSRYTPEQFMKKYSEGKIKIYGLTFPKYVGKDKKDINWEYIWTEFIGTNRDPSELINPPELIDPTSEDMRKRLFTDEEYARITAPMSDEEKYRINHIVFDEDRDSVEGVNVVLPANKKLTKEFVREFPEITGLVKLSKRREASSRGINSFIHDMTMDDIEFFERYDRKHNVQMKNGDEPVFNGDMSSKNVNRYLYEMEEYLNSHQKIFYDGRMRTRDEIQEIQTNAFLYEMGYNVRNCFNNREEEERLKKILKRDKKAEKKLKRRLTAISERKKARQGEIESAKKAGKKKKKKDSSEDD